VTEPAVDEQLVLRSRQGDRAAFEELVRRTARLVYVRAALEAGNASHAEDLVQETFLLAWRKIGQVSDPSGFRPWLLSILHSVIVDSARRQNRRKRSRPRAQDGAMLRLVDGQPSPDESAQLQEQRERALSVLRSMPEEYRQALTLRYLGGADYETISRQLALSNGSLRGLLHRGLKMLREELKEV
jgi:RNA polymerase sigma-70 factor (ECF subfamily)